MFRPVVILFVVFICAANSKADILTFDGITTFDIEGSPTSVDLDGVPTTFTNKQTIIDKFLIGSESYSPILGFNRFDYVTRSNPNPTRVYYENGGTRLPGDARSHDAAPLSTLEEMFSNPLTINYGSDNTFQRTLDSARFWSNSYIEIQNSAGANDSGVVILERGANDNNFRVRAITALDGADNPDTYSGWFTIASGTDPFGSGVNYNLPHALYDSQTADGIGPFVDPIDLRRTQDIGAFLIPFADFGLNIGDQVFGYEIAIASNGSRNGLDLLSGASAVTLDGQSTPSIELSGEEHLPFHANPEIPLANTLMAAGFFLIYFLRNAYLRSKESVEIVS